MTRTLYRAFQSSAALNAGRDAIRDGTTVLTYAGLDELVRRAAGALLALGCRHGDRVGIWANNRWEWPVAALAAQSLGAAIVPCGTRLRASEVARILRRAHARFLFTDPGFGNYDFVAKLALETLPELRATIVFDSRRFQGTVMGFDTFLDQRSELAGDMLEAAIAAVQPDDLADVIFTSGTTGTPKGVPIEHEQSLLACEAQQRDISEFVPGDVFAVTYPFAHNAGYRAGWQAGLLFGVTILVLRSLDALDVLRAIERERVTYLPAVPTLFQGLLDHPERAKFDLSSLRIAATGATTIPIRLIERMQSTFGRNAAMTGYGLTEAAGSVSNTRPGDDARTIVQTTGRPLSNLSVRILDANQSDVPAGEPGEIAVKGPQVMKGYLDDPEATARAFTSDGYLLTGDVGWIDPRGNLSITDRLKDMFIVGGFNTYPAEVEKTLCALPAVAQAAVIGVPDERLGEVGRAFVVLHNDSTTSEVDIVAFCRKELANYKVPRSVRFLKALPRNGTGKVDKASLRSMPD